jgi:hypothetical protein
MRGKRGKILTLALLGAVGCSSDDPDHVAKAARIAAGKLDGLSGGAQGKVAHSVEAFRASWNEIGLDARVAARLRWDKELAGTTIQVRTVGSAVELKGNVATVGQRQRAVQIAHATVGVEDVIDALTVPE